MINQYSATRIAKLVRAIAIAIAGKWKSTNDQLRLASQDLIVGILVEATFNSSEQFNLACVRVRYIRWRTIIAYIS